MYSDRVTLLIFVMGGWVLIKKDFDIMTLNVFVGGWLHVR